MQVTTGETIGKRKAYEVDNELDELFLYIR